MDKPKKNRSLLKRQRKSQKPLTVQVSHAQPDASVLMTVSVPPGSTIRDVFEQSGIRKIVRGIRLVEGQAGIFGEIKPLDTVVRENDRVEIYRPLAATPSESRKKRAAQKKTETRAPAAGEAQEKN